MGRSHIMKALARQDIRGDLRLALLSAADSAGKVLSVSAVAEWVGCAIDEARDITEEMVRLGEFEWFDAGWFAVSILSEEELLAISDECARRIATKSLRTKVFKRDGAKCAYCGDTSGPFELDHILPYSRGGKTSLVNLTVSCAPCNRSKGDKTLEEWRGRAQ
jgi:hypothetical protein